MFSSGNSILSKYHDMKVGLLANTSWYVYNFRRNLLCEIRRQGHDVFVIAPFDKYTQKICALGIPCFQLHLHQTSRNPAREFLSFLQLWHVLRSARPDFLLTFTIKCNIYAGLLSALCKFRQIANISGLGEGFNKSGFFTKFIASLYRFSLYQAEKVFFQNQEDLKRFLQLGILQEVQCAKLPGSGVDLEMFRPGLTEKPRERRVFLMFGRIVPGKGYELFLQTAERIKQLACGNVEFWVLGIQDTSRKASMRLFQKILNAHRQGLIRYMSQTDNVVPVVQQADVVVLPSSYHEGVPRSLLEALACGKPIITTNWKGCRDTVEHGENGFLVETYEDLEKSVMFFIQAPISVFEKMGTASRKKAEQEFDEWQVIKKYLSELGGNAR